MPPDAPSLAERLSEAGYDCGLAGKLHLSAADGRIERRPDDGYRVFHWSHGHRDGWPRGHVYNEWLKGQGQDYNTPLAENGYIPAPLHQTAWCADRAIEFIEEETAPWTTAATTRRTI